MLNAAYIKNPDVVFRKIADEFVLVPIRQRAVDLRSIYTLNETAAFVWGLLDGAMTVGQIGDKMAQEYETDISQAGSDIAMVLSQLEALGFIKKG